MDSPQHRTGLTSTTFRAGLVGLVATLCAFASTSASAGGAVVTPHIDFVDMFRSGFATQQNNGPAFANTFYGFDTHLYATTDNYFATAMLTAPTALPMITQDAHTFDYSALFPDQGALDAAFPVPATYVYTATPASGPVETTSFTLPFNLYPFQQPFLLGTDYTALQNLDVTAPFTVHFDPLSGNSFATYQFVFFTIRDLVTNALVVDDGFLPAATTTDTIAANTLLPGHDYAYELIYSNRLLLPGIPAFDSAPPGSLHAASVGFDLRTQGFFSTAEAIAAVPEPGSGALLAAALAVLAARVARRRLH